jgi:hypothetical protein
MGQLLKVNGDYSIKVIEGSTITLDTGVESGNVIVTGDLTVRGVTTTIESIDLVIEGNIVTLNRGEIGAGVTLETSGLEIDRGSLDNALLIFDENLTWYNPVTDQTQNGAWTIRDKTNKLGSLQLADLSTTQTTFNLVDTIATTINFGRVANTITIGSPSGITTINAIKFESNSVEVTTGDDILIKSVLNIANLETVPSTPVGYIKLYSSDTPGTGGTGLYFVNTEGTNDELISKTKAILYSLIF